jgi:hypothetical protein
MDVAQRRVIEAGMAPQRRKHSFGIWNGHFGHPATIGGIERRASLQIKAPTSPTVHDLAGKGRLCSLNNNAAETIFAAGRSNRIREIRSCRTIAIYLWVSLSAQF